DFDLRMLPKPFGCPGGCAILQHVDDLAPLEVNDDSPVSATLSPAPIVDACHPYRRPRAETGDLPFQMPQNGVVADWHAETFHQPFSRPATSAVAEKMNKFSDSLGPPSVRTNNFRQLIRKCLTLALPVSRWRCLTDGDRWMMSAVGPEVGSCPRCRAPSTRRHSRYFRHLQDLPVQGAAVVVK